MTKIILNNQKFDLDAIAALMDDELRETLHSEKNWQSEQEFLDAYCKAHAQKFGEDFTIN